MRKLFNLFIISIAATMVFSCNYLEENMGTTLTEDGVYVNEDALESNVRGILRAFHGDAMYPGNMMEHLNGASGLIHWISPARLGDERWDCLLKLTESAMNLNSNMYAGHYTGINRANKLLEGLETSPVSEEYKKEIAAEAKFYRAIFYFGLVRCYGSVPLKLKSTSSQADLASPRVPYYEVYAQIVKDFEEAFEDMRSPQRVVEVTGTQGRPNKWAAKAYLSCVYLHIASILDVDENDNFYDASKPGRKPDFSALGINDAQAAWTLALNTAKDVIENGPYRLAAKYSDLFQWSDDFISDSWAGLDESVYAGAGYGSWNSPERIFVIQFTNNDTQNYTAMRSLPQYPEGSQTTKPASRYGNWRPTRFFFQSWCEAYPGLHGTSEDNSDIYVTSSDPRLDIALIHTSYIKCNDGSIQKVYPLTGTIKGSGQSTSLPFFKKYNSPKYSGTCGFADLYMLRLAELYYIAAEASAKLGNTADAYKYVEAVHLRARHSTADGIEATAPKWINGQFATDKELIDAIRWDKIFELCAEGHEFFETHRNGAAWLSEHIAVPLNIALKNPNNAALGTATYSKASYLSEDGTTVINPYQYPTDPQELRRSLLCAFPLEELAYNPALDSETDQNDFIW